jgi:hypothetical protein
MTKLLRAGVQVLDPSYQTRTPITPPDVAWMASSCGPDDGRVDAVTDDHDPDRIRKGNAVWHRLARAHGLFDPNGDFLLCLPDPGSVEDASWARVRLLAGWDLVGVAAAEKVLGHGAGVPAFVAHSIDANLLLACTYYETYFTTIAIPRPYGAATLRRYAERRLAGDDWTPQQKVAAESWLASNRREP